MNRALTGVLALVIISASCSSPKKTTTAHTPAPAVNKQEPHRKNIACGGIMKDAKQPRLDWIIEDNSVLDSITTLPKPDGYKVYSLDTLQAREFFRQTKDTSQKLSVVIPLPAPLGCRVYALSSSGVMNAKLAEKYPDLVALQGSDQQGASQLRLNYDGKWVKGQVLSGGKTYLVNPVRSNGVIYYMVYARSDSKEVKEPFEGGGVKTTK